MSRKQIRIAFTDFLLASDERIALCRSIFEKQCDVVIDEKRPQYVISAGLGCDYMKYVDCIKIALIGENCAPDFNLFDYAIGFDHMVYGDRYLRVPLFVFYPDFAKMKDPVGVSDEKLLDREFCSFVVSNTHRDPLCFDFVNELSKYKEIACGGMCMNNVGGPVQDKRAFCARYKFNIAFENCASLGYTTEKIMEPLGVGSIPVYWGNPLIERDFNLECMVHIKDRGSMRAAVEEIIELDRNDAAYLRKCHAAKLANPEVNYDEMLEEFLLNIVIPPYEEARRLCDFAFQGNYRYRMKKIFTCYRCVRDVYRFASPLIKDVKKIIH